MIPYNRFLEIEKGNFILFSSGKLRKVTKVTKFATRMLLSFDKVNGSGTAIYMYSDIKHKIKAIIKPKK